MTRGSAPQRAPGACPRGASAPGARCPASALARAGRYNGAEKVGRRADERRVPRRPTAAGCGPRPRHGGRPLRGVGMSHRFTRRFRVRHYELDAAGRVSDVSLVRYMQESAIEASAALGLGPDWYRERGTAWVVRRLAIRCLAPAGYGDEVG